MRRSPRSPVPRRSGSGAGRETPFGSAGPAHARSSWAISIAAGVPDMPLDTRRERRSFLLLCSEAPMSSEVPVVSAGFPGLARTPAPPDLASIPPGLDLEREIRELKRQKRAVLLAHSLDISRNAQKSDADIIAFAGVRFMAETAKILNPSRKVVLPDYEAGCSLENSCPPEAFRAWREAHPGAVSLTYINCSATVKALSDIIVTSSNAEKIVASVPPEKEILFAPDRHLGAFLAKKTGRPMTLWPGACIVHEQFSEREIVRLKAQNPGAHLAAHPECPEPILRHADHVGSTRSILHYVTAAPRQRLPLQRMSLHEAEHPGKALPLPPRRTPRDPPARGDPEGRREASPADAGTVVRARLRRASKVQGPRSKVARRKPGPLGLWTILISDEFAYRSGSRREAARVPGGRRGLRRCHDGVDRSPGGGGAWAAHREERLRRLGPAHGAEDFRAARSRPRLGGRGAGRLRPAAGFDAREAFGAGARDPDRRARGVEPAPADVRHRDGYAALCRGGRGDRLQDPRHAQDGARAAGVRPDGRHRRRRFKSPGRPLRHGADQGQPSKALRRGCPRRRSGAPARAPRDEGRGRGRERRGPAGSARSWRADDPDRQPDSGDRRAVDAHRPGALDSSWNRGLGQHDARPRARLRSRGSGRGVRWRPDPFRRRRRHRPGPPAR